MRTHALPMVSVPPVRRRPSQDGLRLIVAGTGYLLVVAVIAITSSLLAGFGAGSWIPARLADDRDLLALFGWVGLMITGVSAIILPNHLGVRLRPSYLPRLHLVLANVGLAGFLLGALAFPGSAASDGFLALVAASFLLFGLGLLRTVAPFLRLDPVPPDARTGKFSEPGIAEDT